MAAQSTLVDAQGSELVNLSVAEDLMVLCGRAMQTELGEHAAPMEGVDDGLGGVGLYFQRRTFAAGARLDQFCCFR